jgi:lysophospholipase L1-like esterase
MNAPIRLFSSVLAGAALAACLVVTGPSALAQQGGGSGSADRGAASHWVGTWATAVVARLQGPQGARQGFGPPPQGPQGTPPAFGPPPQAQAPQALAPQGQPSVPLPVAPPVAFPVAPPVAVPGAPPPVTPPGAPPRPESPAQNGAQPGGRGGRGGAPPLNFNNQTLRQIVHTSIGGDRVRVVLTNAFGTAPLAVGAAHVALREQDAAIAARSDRTLTFAGNPSTTIPAGAVIVSDPVSLTVPAFADLAIDLYLPGDTASTTSPLTTHAGAQQTSYVSPAGDHTGAADMPVMTMNQSWFFLSRVEVAAPEQVGAVVTFGDSITDGTRSTPNSNNRWPDQLARRLATQNIKMGVLNEGIAGNRVLGDGAGVNALARFDRDVLVQTGVTHVIVLESINDIGLARDNPSPTAADLIAGHRQLIERAHARGLKIFGATLTPFEGAAYWTRDGEAKRGALNEWIRTGKAYDGVIDFDMAVRDPGAPTKLQPQFNPGDNLHMTDAGYQAMANAIDLALFKAAATKSRASR